MTEAEIPVSPSYRGRRNIPLTDQEYGRSEDAILILWLKLMLRENYDKERCGKIGNGKVEQIPRTLRMKGICCDTKTRLTQHRVERNSVVLVKDLAMKLKR